MKESPIIFKDYDIALIKKGLKIQTRRVINYPKLKVIHAIYNDGSIDTNCIFRKGDQRIHCSYGKPGDLLWVRESINFKSPIFMKKSDCKLWLFIKSLAVQKLQDITTEDVIKEGKSSGSILEFSQSWDRINPGHKWVTNPFVWVIEFEKSKESE